ncbi:dTDP-glucose 4,6-dehydratase [Gracilinema caldarium]|uniref:dTDP-glucose 4,6-dehydratase n=1 Tax=Gracilinema caldarium (strain ATCC 51460 / DSM 7334 / H1) TaxID=744872 RepID=F8F043_GRAC1|nr:dTDP-glucose 4,6-dehydratase [Gracilinema caldarium]AEJ18696.1 dTDP-glucose 4,6-dehydratase [Gracilinema caldarium DSM 7334]
MRTFKNLLVTGGAGFIGSNMIRYLLSGPSGFTGRVINLDLLTYAGNPESLADIQARYGSGSDPRYIFVQGDICDRPLIERLFTDYQIDGVIHFAAESHVDRSILGPEAFVRTNVMGTFTLLDVARTAWAGKYTAGHESQNAEVTSVLFHHISTDEVYGSLGDSGYFTETTPYDPRSPYSASKASSDHLVMAYHHTYGLPVTLTNCSNNYGPYQFPEKLIPLMVLNMLEGKPLPVYGDGKNIRDWLYVEDHNSAVWLVMQQGRVGEKYNIGGENEWQNIELLQELINLVAEETGKPAEALRSLITYVKDRPGHDRRYAIDCTKLKTELGWKQSVNFSEGLRKTLRWYLANPEWISHVRSGSYRTWIEKNYEKR